MRATGGWRQIEAICDMVLRQALAAGIKLGRIQGIDSVHCVADVDNAADRERQVQGKPPRDRQRKWCRRANGGR